MNTKYVVVELHSGAWQSDGLPYTSVAVCGDSDCVLAQFDAIVETWDKQSINIDTRYHLLDFLVSDSQVERTFCICMELSLTVIKTTMPITVL